MALKNFKLLNTNGLKGLDYKGGFIKFEDIDDELAEELIDKTHVLERVSDAPTPRANRALTAGAPAA